MKKKIPGKNNGLFAPGKRKLIRVKTRLVIFWLSKIPNQKKD